MATELPFLLRLNIVVGPEVPVSRLWDFVTHTLAARPGFKPNYWRTWVDRDAGPGLDAGKVKGMPPSHAISRRGLANFAGGFEVQGKQGGLMVQPLTMFGADQPDETFGIDEGWRIFDLVGNYRTPEACIEELGWHLHVLRQALNRLEVLRADQRRVSNTCLGPYPALADPEAVALLALTDEVAADYPDPDAYWAIWDRVEHLGAGKALCSRAMTVAHEAEYKARALRDGFALGRAARPGLTKYYPAPALSPAEGEALLANLPRCLIQAGYAAETKLLEFTAVPEPGEPLSPGDIFDLLNFRYDGTSDGRPVELLVVSFPDRDTAVFCAPPLRDIGVLVQYFAEDGTWRVLD